jgi:hypothetical protein
MIGASTASCIYRETDISFAGIYLEIEAQSFLRQPGTEGQKWMGKPSVQPVEDCMWESKFKEEINLKSGEKILSVCSDS